MKKLFVMIICTIMLLSACQPTPQKQVVVQKDMEQMIEKAVSSPSIQTIPEISPPPDEHKRSALYDKLGIPERYTEDIADASGRFRFTADIEPMIPDADTLPMAWVEAANFEQELVSKLFNALCGDTKMYVYDFRQTKAEIEAQIIEDKERLAKAKTEREKKFWNDVIKNEEKAYKEAPQSIEYKLSNGTLQSEDIQFEETDVLDGKRTSLIAIEHPKKRGGRYFSIANNTEYKNSGGYSYKDKYGNTQVFSQRSESSFSYMRDYDEHPLFANYEGHERDESIKSISITAEEAQRCAEDFLKSIGVEDMAAEKATFMSSYYDDEELERLVRWITEERDAEELAGIISEYGSVEAYFNRGKERQGYEITFLRVLNGVSVVSDLDSTVNVSTDGDITAAPEWYNEKLRFIVDDKGIAAIEWTQPLKVVELISGDAAVLPFGEIQGVIEKMIQVTNADIAADEQLSIDATRLRLSLMRINARDTFTRGLLVPVWTLYGVEYYGSESEAFDGGWPKLIVNAVDGSIIDMHKGY